MNRRSVVKGLLIFAGGVAVLPSCVLEEGKASIPLDHLDVSEGQEKLLAEMVETILPTTDTPGAREMGLHLFALKMVDDCYSEQDRQAFMQGMAAFEGMAKKQTGDTFLDASPKQRQEIIVAVNGKNAPEEVQAFYSILKNETIKGYLNSELVMTQLRVYELVPGRYDAYYPITKAQIS
ncbi:gluconate 2-dehydrogenase subunit 3 family protein [Pontibacter anaerobius]|uniref:Gluconate 2-dehydrogenase subunit 3 family protein n=1 Tax=Pontibacter anaerobius TaxID=2993940 RepID=A0ABT3RDA1_9BACT|nr:gluconate 2-dehydrogenase subunit 3 family protein [Pontibacter anaerobius]MCX2739527.1 gluconate 2-dehydrogenase subunit 3 family protein [Pontibacter anaerobius]